MFSFLRELIALLEDWMCRGWWQGFGLAGMLELPLSAMGWQGKNGRLLPRSPRGPCGGSWTSRSGVQGRSLFRRVNWGLSVRIPFETMRLDEITVAERAREKQQRGKAKARVLCQVRRGRQRHLSPMSRDSPSSPSFSFPFGKSEAKQITIYWTSAWLTNLVLYYKCEVLNCVVCFHDNERYVIVNQSCLSC